MNHNKLSKAVILLFLLSSCINRSENSKWQSLFNGKDLSGWDTYLGPVFDTGLNRRDTVPVGLNNDLLKVFDVTELGGEKVMRISGEQFGGISTIKEFEDFHLQLQFRWGKLQWPPRNKGKKDSGLMYYAVGPQGADGGFWLRSHEFQIEEGDCGDYWACAGAVFDVRARKKSDSAYVYNKDGDLYTFSTVSPNGRYCQKYPDAEKPSGEWNTLDLYCFGGTSVHVVNGVVTMVLNNSRQLEGNKEIPLTKGKIQFESEGSEIFFRNIKICSIDKIPDNILKDQKPSN
ncbi:MAG: DUF1080 domain-containing protein [Bacteroidales bacterium]|jgi:hypothetical protein